MNQLKDFLNQPLNVGDIVTYPIRRGSWMEMRFAKITSITSLDGCHFDIRTVTYSERFVYSESKYELDTKKYKFIFEQVDKGIVSKNWKTADVFLPIKSYICVPKRLIKIHRESLPEHLYECLIDEVPTVTNIRVES